jgi:hypothetical protein
MRIPLATASVLLRRRYSTTATSTKQAITATATPAVVPAEELADPLGLLDAATTVTRRLAVAVFPLWSEAM